MMTYYTDESVAKRQNKKLTYDTFVAMQSSESRSDREGRSSSHGSWRRGGLSIDTNVVNRETNTQADDRDDVAVETRKETLSPGMGTSEEIRNKRRQRLARMALNKDNMPEPTTATSPATSPLIKKTASMEAERRQYHIESPMKEAAVIQEETLSSPYFETSTVSKRHTESPLIVSPTRQSNKHSTTPCQSGAFTSYPSPERVVSPHSYRQDDVFAEDSDDTAYGEDTVYEEERQTETRYQDDGDHGPVSARRLYEPTSNNLIVGEERREEAESRYDGPVIPSGDRYIRQHTSANFHSTEAADSEVETRYKKSAVSPTSRNHRRHRSSPQVYPPRDSVAGTMDVRYEGPGSPSRRHRRQHSSKFSHQREPTTPENTRYDESPVSPSRRQAQRNNRSPTKTRRHQQNGSHDMRRESPLDPRLHSHDQFFPEEQVPRSRPPQPQLLSSRDYVRSQDQLQAGSRGNVLSRAPHHPRNGRQQDNRAPDSMSMVVAASRQQYGPRDALLKRYGSRHNVPTPPNMTQQLHYQVQSTRHTIMSGSPMTVYDGDDDIREPTNGESRMSPMFEERSYVSQGSKRVVGNNGNAGCQAFQCQSVITKIWACGTMNDVLDSEPRQNRFEVFAEESVTAFSVGINDLTEKVAFVGSQMPTSPLSMLNEDKDEEEDDKNIVQPVANRDKTDTAGHFSFLATAHDNANIAEAFEAFTDEVKNVKSKATEANNAISKIVNRNFDMNRLQTEGTSIHLRLFDGDGDSEPSTDAEDMKAAEELTTKAYAKPTKGGLYASVVQSKNRSDMFANLQKERTKTVAGCNPTSPKESTNDTEQLRQIYRSLHQSIHAEPEKLETFVDAKETNEVVIEELFESDESSQSQDAESKRDDSFDYSLGQRSDPGVQNLTNNETMSLSGMISMIEASKGVLQKVFDTDPVSTKEETVEDEMDQEPKSEPIIEEEDEDSKNEVTMATMEKPETETVWESAGTWDIAHSVAESHEVGINFEEAFASEIKTKADTDVCTKPEFDKRSRTSRITLMSDDEENSSSDAEIEAELSQLDDESVMSSPEERLNRIMEGYDGPTDEQILAELMGEVEDKEESDFVKSIFNAESEDDDDQTDIGGETPTQKEDEAFQIDHETVIKAASSLLESMSEKKVMKPAIEETKVPSESKRMTSSTEAMSSEADDESQAPTLTREQVKFRAFWITVFLYISGILGFVFERIADHYSDPAPSTDSPPDIPLVASAVMDELQDATRELQGTLQGSQ